jgi:uncharacterized protein YegL
MSVEETNSIRQASHREAMLVESGTAYMSRGLPAVFQIIDSTPRENRTGTVFYRHFAFTRRQSFKSVVFFSITTNFICNERLNIIREKIKNFSIN